MAQAKETKTTTEVNYPSFHHKPAIAHAYKNVWCFVSGTSSQVIEPVRPKFEQNEVQSNVKPLATLPIGCVKL
jgi:hypothetical protein